MSKIRVGSIGLGGICAGAHLPGLHECGDTEIYALCDIDKERVRLMGERYGVDKSRWFYDYRDLIACEGVDAVDICTPNHLHFDIAMAATEAGKPFACEKPVCLNGEQADRLAEAVARAKVKTMICFSYRYKAAARYARELIERGLIGRVYHADMQYAQAWGLPVFEAKRVWRFDKAQAGSGALGDLGCHALDLVRFITGQEYTRVTAHDGTFIHSRKALTGDDSLPVDVDDFSNYSASLSGGGAACFRITRFAYGRGNYQRLEIYGDKGGLVYELDADGDGKDELCACLEPIGKETHRYTRLPIPNRCKCGQMQSFADILLGKPDGLSATIEDARVNQHTLDAILLSAREGRSVDIG